MKGESYDHLVKILMIGESGVGKTCMIQRFSKNEFSMNHLSTIAIDFKLKQIEVNGVKLKMQIWDTAGQERFNTLTNSFFKGKFKRLRWNNSVVFSNRLELV
jgi:Ras-related protein Rab-8A